MKRAQRPHAPSEPRTPSERARAHLERVAVVKLTDGRLYTCSGTSATRIMSGGRMWLSTDNERKVAGASEPWGGLIMLYRPRGLSLVLSSLIYTPAVDETFG